MKKLLLTALFIINVFAKDIAGYDLTFLKAYNNEHPNSIRCKELLLTHYIAKNDIHNMIKYSKQIHTLDPKNKILANLINQVNKTDKVKKLPVSTAKKTLDKLFKEKNYFAYINFYQTLVSLKKDVPKETHVDALYSAIMINKYDLAKKILKRKDLPMSSHLSTVMRILDRKIIASK